MNGILVAAVASALVALAVVVMGLSLAAYREEASVRRSVALVQRMGILGAGSTPPVSAPAIGWARSIVDQVTGLLVLPGHRAWMQRRLARAGRLRPADVQRAVDAKVALAAGGLLLGVVAVVTFGPIGWVLALVAIAVGYELPDLLVYNLGLKRTEAVRLGLPDALDLLNLCVESGLSLSAAMSKVAEVQSGAVAEEFARVLQEMRLGVSRSDALEALAERSTESDLRQLVGAILQAESLGIPIAAVLREQASDMRARRRSRAREAAQKLPVKILAPLVLCFLPALFIIILGPAAITVVEWLTSRP
jgi:tight adherence protein C